MKAIVEIRWQLVRDYVFSGRFRELEEPVFEVMETDRGDEADYIVFRMGEREKTFFQRLGMATPAEKNKLTMHEVAAKLMEQKLNSELYEDPKEEMMINKYKKRKEEIIRIAEEQAKAKKAKEAGQQKPQESGLGGLETLSEQPDIVITEPNGVEYNDGVDVSIANPDWDHCDQSVTTDRSGIHDINMDFEKGVFSDTITERDKRVSMDTDKNFLTDRNSVHDGVTKDILMSSQSRKSTASLRMRPARLHRLDTSDGFDFDENEDIPIKDLKNYQSPRRLLTKTKDMYNVACALCGVVPLRNYVKQCTSRFVNLSNTMMAAKTVKPIAISLVMDSRVLDLDVSENNIGPLGTMYISEMMTKNNYITELNLSCTYPGREGLRVLSESLKFNTALEILKLETNKIQHTETHLLTSLIENVRNLKELYLGHNAIGYEGGCALAKCLENNTTLRLLDLQWNHIRKESASALCKSLSSNVGLRTLDVSWNGLGKEGCIALATSLPKNAYLKSLTITSNRIDMLSLRFLLHGLVRNKTLRSLEMGRNPVTTEGAKAVLRAVQSSKSSALQRICLDGISVDEKFINIMRELKEKKGVRVTHGEMLSNGNMVEEKAHDPHDLNRFDPVMVLVEYMRIDNLRLIDFFQYLDTSSRERLSKSDFRDGVANLSIPLTEHHLDMVMEKVDLKKDGFVDLEEFMTVHREVSRQITNRTTKARSKHKEDEGLVSLRKILREIVDKRNKTNKEKASTRHNQQERELVNTKNRSLTVTKPSFLAQSGQRQNKQS